MTQTPQTFPLGNGVHALAAGAGTPVVLLPGWPETAEAYSDVLPSLSERHRVLAIDPPGLGESSGSTEGYDTGSISRQIEEAVRPFTPEPIHSASNRLGVLDGSGLAVSADFTTVACVTPALSVSFLAGTFDFERASA